MLFNVLKVPPEYVFNAAERGDRIGSWICEGNKEWNRQTRKAETLPAIGKDA